MPNLSWTHGNIGRLIQFGKCRFYINTSAPGVYDSWYELDLKNQTLKPTAKTIPVLAGTAWQFPTNFSSFYYGRATSIWNFSQSLHGHCYSPYAQELYMEGLFINGRHPSRDIFVDSVRVPAGQSIINEGYITLFHPFPDFVTVSVPEPNSIGINYVNEDRYSYTGVVSSSCLLNPTPSSNYTLPPISTFAARALRDRFQLNSAGTTYIDVTNPGFSKPQFQVHPSPNVQIYPEYKYTSTNVASKFIVIRLNYFGLTLEDPRFIVELCHVPANSTDESFAPTVTIDLGLSTVTASYIRDAVTVHIEPDFSKARLAYPRVIGDMQWVYDIFDVDFIAQTYTHTTQTIGYHERDVERRLDMVCSGIMWMSMTELVFGVLEGSGVRIVKNGVTVLSAALPPGMNNTPGNYENMRSLYGLRPPTEVEFGGHLELDKGFDSSVGYFIFSLVGRFNDYFWWIDTGASAYPAAYRVICGIF